MGPFTTRTLICILLMKNVKIILCLIIYLEWKIYLMIIFLFCSPMDGVGRPTLVWSYIAHLCTAEFAHTDGHDMVFGGKPSHKYNFSFCGLLASPAFGRYNIKIFIGASLHFRGKNSFSNLYYMGSSVTNWRCNLVESVVSLIVS
jgi:hypothetical protein